MEHFLYILGALCIAVRAYERPDFLHSHPASDRIGNDIKINEELYRNESFRRGRIVGGPIAYKGQFPWQLGLHSRVSGVTYFCGGSLVTFSTVITAAHCIVGATEIFIVAGAHRINDIEEGSQVSRRVFADHEGQIVIHSGFNTGGGLENDIGVLNVEEAFPRTTYIQLIGMPNLSDAGRDFTELRATTSGWGKPSDSSTGMSLELRYVETDIMTNEECRNWYGFVITDRHICNSGAGGRSPCDGDNGGPMIVVDKGVEKQIGIVSLSSGMECSGGYPHIYTRLTMYFGWLNEASFGKIVFAP